MGWFRSGGEIKKKSPLCAELMREQRICDSSVINLQLETPQNKICIIIQKTKLRCPHFCEDTCFLRSNTEQTQVFWSSSGLIWSHLLRSLISIAKTLPRTGRVMLKILCGFLTELKSFTKFISLKDQRISKGSLVQHLQQLLAVNVSLQGLSW